MTAPARNTSRRIPGLDGLRGICILAVLFGHLSGTRDFPIGAAAAHVWSIGSLALLVFFVLSGFLISLMVLEERERTGQVRLGRFYFRRTVRMAPPYFALVLGLAVMNTLGWIRLNPGDLSHAATYTSNYYPQRSWFVGHTWSASVQEQFYLLWPAVLVLFGTRRAAIIAALTVVLIPAIRLAEWEIWRWEPVGHRFETIADSMAAGCVLACIRPQLHKIPAYLSLLRAPWFFLLPVLALAANMMHDHPRAEFAVGVSVIVICVTLTLDWIMTFPDGRVGRVLNWAPLRAIGLVSYSLYLWQQPFLNRESPAFYARFPVNVLFAFGAGLAAFYLVEQPTLNLRKHLDAKRKNAKPPVPAEAVALMEALPQRARATATAGRLRHDPDSLDYSGAPRDRPHRRVCRRPSAGDDRARRSTARTSSRGYDVASECRRAEGVL